MRIAITGANGMLGHAIARKASDDGHTVFPLSREQLDITDESSVHHQINSLEPDAIFHCAAFTRVDDAENAPDLSALVNSRATGYVADAAAAAGSLFVYPSTDYVFDGTKQTPYTPDDPPRPMTAYGRSKLGGEISARKAPRHLIVRTSWLYGQGGKNFVTTILQRARDGSALNVVDDQRGTPTWTVELARMLMILTVSQVDSGVYHASNSGETTWADFARAILELANRSADIVPVASSEYPQVAARPSYSVLDCSSTYDITGAAPHWRDSLREALPGLA